MITEPGLNIMVGEAPSDVAGVKVNQVSSVSAITRNKSDGLGMQVSKLYHSKRMTRAKKTNEFERMRHNIEMRKLSKIESNACKRMSNEREKVRFDMQRLLREKAALNLNEPAKRMRRYSGDTISSSQSSSSSSQLSGTEQQEILLDSLGVKNRLLSLRVQQYNPLHVDKIVKPLTPPPTVQQLVEERQNKARHRFKSALNAWIFIHQVKSEVFKAHAEHEVKMKEDENRRREVQAKEAENQKMTLMKKMYEEALASRSDLSQERSKMMRKQPSMPFIRDRSAPPPLQLIRSNSMPGLRVDPSRGRHTAFRAKRHTAATSLLRGISESEGRVYIPPRAAIRAWSNVFVNKTQETNENMLRLRIAEEEIKEIR